MANSLRKRIVASLGAVALVVALASSGLLPKAASVALDDAGQLAGGIAATVVCWRTGRRRSGAQRRWRLLMAAGMACWTGGMLVWALYRSVLDVPLPSPSYADFGFFLFPIFAVPALLSVMRRAPHQSEDGSRYHWLTSLLDGLIVVGSLFVMSWATVLGPAARSDRSDSVQFLIALMYPITDLVLLVMVGLLAVIPRVLRRYRAQLTLLGAGLTCLAISDSLYAYLVAAGADEMPLIADAGFIAGPVLIALAASAPSVAVAVAVPTVSVPDSVPKSADTPPGPPGGREGERTRLLVPHALMALTGVSVAIQRFTQGTVDPIAFGLFLTVIVLAVVRQVMTLLQNDALLRTLYAAQNELTYRAHHDGLTGLLNRSAFDEHLTAAIDRHNDNGDVGVLLLVDLDDFKAINDRLGHGAGDRSLKTLSSRLVDTVNAQGNGGVVARFGGDEFTVLIPASIDAGCTTARSIVDALRAPQDIEGHTVSIGASVGVVELDVFEQAVTADTLLRNADRAMYEAKKNGKAGVFAYDSDGTLRMVYNLSVQAAPFNWFGHGHATADAQGNRGMSPNIVAGEPDPARLIGPPTRT
ncbi:GGDEF domain-containing protein [Rhodococcus sp. 14-2470-1b]|jgi:diguanylate cyclase (GGDEF)-like protein|uniref:GGDEF domain-containing protein n=1 Tax=Rhodococcus sp. 14-2470-1b TaxID=2023149 RepID=UPI000B9BFEC4|nr:GGDEF domain-containing protein [Rhodococcus sp. 14-2470-1b]OZF43993.1 GGDEF domain-containing protein [Rhodococcus sp. 14-2470-1b]